MDIKKKFGLKIKRLRMKSGYTQEELAEKVGIAARTMSGIEIGENFVTASTLEKLLTELHISPAELFAFDHIKPQEELVTEIINDIKKLKNRNKIETIYKIVKAVIVE